MTHDELLIKLDKEITKCTCRNDDWAGVYPCVETHYNKFIYAIRAVVKLHKPMPPDLSGFIGCDGCSEGDDDYYQPEYPCPTIQAIEKELK